MQIVRKKMFFLAAVALLTCLTMAKPLAGESNYPTLEDRRSQLLQWADPTYKRLDDHLIRTPYWILGDTAVNGCKDSYSNYMVDFKNHTKDDQTLEIFVLPAVVRYLYQFESCLSAQNKEVLREYVSNGLPCCHYRYFGHGTLNTAIVQATSWYLLAQFFKEGTWVHYSNSEYSSDQIMDTIYANLVNRFKSHIEYGHFEMASPNYGSVNFFALINLVDFSNSAELKTLAIGEANKTIQYLNDNSFKGKLIPPLTRQTSNELNGSISKAGTLSRALGLDRQLIWYYLDPSLDLTVEDFRNHRSQMIWILYVLSDWLPEISEYNDPGQDEVVAVDIPGFSTWGEENTVDIVITGRKFIGESYALSSSNIRYTPYWATDDVVEFGLVIDSDNLFNQIDCTQPYWRSNTSADIDSSDKIRWYDRSSPFMQTHLIDKHNMLFIADIPEKDPFTEYETQFTKTRSSHLNQLNQFVRCRIPKGFDAINKGEHVILVQEGKTYIQIESLSQPFRYESDDYYQYFILEGGKSAMHFYLTDKVSSMSELSNQASQNSASYTPDNNQILFTAPEQSNQVKMTFNNVLYQDSDSDLAEREIMYESIPLIEEVSQ